MINAGLVSGLITGAMAAPLNAHPHVYVDTGVEFLFNDDGALAAVRVVWVYDELYSLLITEDLGLDTDFDGILMPQEREKLSGFDMNWAESFAGDTIARGTEGELALSRPLEWTADLRDGRIVTTHLRAFDTPIDPGTHPVELRLFDPSFYTAYSASLPTTFTGREGCAAEVIHPDLEEAYAFLEATIRAQPENADVELDFPAVGATFADEIHLTCAS